MRIESGHGRTRALGLNHQSDTRGGSGVRREVEVEDVPLVARGTMHHTSGVK